MRRVTPVVLAAAGLLLALDVVGALANQPLGFPYSSLGAVSLLIYLGVGLLCGLRAGFLAGIIAATLVGLLDSTLGPLAAWMAGSGPVGQIITEEGVIAYGVSVVTATAAAAGTVGALAGVWLERWRGLRAGSRISSS